MGDGEIAIRIPWNIVTENISPDGSRLPLEKKLQQKIAKVDRHLAHFAADAVHLQIVLESVQHRLRDEMLAQKDVA